MGMDNLHKGKQYIKQFGIMAFILNYFKKWDYFHKRKKKYLKQNFRNSVIDTQKLKLKKDNLYFTSGTTAMQFSSYCGLL